MTAAQLFRVETRADNGTETPGPGKYPGTPMQTYHRWNAASNSRFSRLLKSPAHLRAYLNEPPDETAALIAGRAIHSAVLEPDDFKSYYIAGPDGDRRTKAIKEEWDALLLKYGPGRVLKLDAYQMALDVRDSVYKHRTASALLKRRTSTELSLLWQCDDVLCKARLDARAEIDGGTIIDLKSTNDASKDSFERSIFAYGYHRQGALYLDGAVENQIGARHYAIIAVEKTPPYAVAVYRIREDAIAAGWQQLDPLFPLYRKCIETNEWPGYKDEVVDISLPTWAWEKIDAETMEKKAS